MNLEQAYKNLVEFPTRSFIQTKDGDLVSIHAALNPGWFTYLHVFSGTFAELNEGQKTLFSRIPTLNSMKIFEINIKDSKQEFLSVEQLKQTLKQFIGLAPVLITTQGSFLEKAGLLRLFTNVVFHIGPNTMIQMLKQMSQLEIQGINCQFIVHSYAQLENSTELPFLPKNCQILSSDSQNKTSKRM